MNHKHCVICGKELTPDPDYPNNNTCQHCWDNIDWAEE